jgi:hypothetical protein
MRGLLIGFPKGMAKATNAPQAEADGHGAE